MFDRYKVLHIPSGEFLINAYSTKQYAESHIEYWIYLLSKIKVFVVREEFEIIPIPWGRLKRLVAKKEPPKPVWSYNDIDKLLSLLRA